MYLKKVSFYLWGKLKASPTSTTWFLKEGSLPTFPIYCSEGKPFYSFPGPRVYRKRNRKEELIMINRRRKNNWNRDFGAFICRNTSKDIVREEVSVNWNIPMYKSLLTHYLFRTVFRRESEYFFIAFGIIYSLNTVQNNVVITDQYLSWRRKFEDPKGNVGKQTPPNKYNKTTLKYLK